MISTYATDFCQLDLYPRFAVLRIFENEMFDLSKANILRSKFVEVFKNQEFVLITDRSLYHDIDLRIYKDRRLRNMKGLAIVSQNPVERDRALKEQALFDDSFAFFERLDDAIHWAGAFFRNY
jgi:hypothetical protein